MSRGPFGPGSPALPRRCVTVSRENLTDYLVLFGRTVFVVVCRPLLIVSEDRERLFELSQSTLSCKSLDALAKSPYSPAFARYWISLNTWPSSIELRLFDVLHRR
jgi:hypothetical protein